MRNHYYRLARYNNRVQPRATHLFIIGLLVIEGTKNCFLFTPYAYGIMGRYLIAEILH